ncbi:MAG: hypothetical protein WBD20_19185 [Pirellulaceae bacterium]
MTFRDADKKVVASLIIGDNVKDADGQVNVRIPGQDPVYIVALDDKPLTTKFQDWIEEDLLKLSSIDIETMQVKDYSADLGPSGQISLQRNYTGEFKKDGSQWTLAKLQEFDPKRPTAPPTDVEVKDDQKLNTTKLNTVQNALDDLKIVNVLRKPDGMSANLRASEDFLSDQKAVASLAGRGFYPVQMDADGDTEILSANGEMTVGLKDGVEYVLRFGNIAGLTEDDDASDDDDAKEGEEKKSVNGVNRYLLLTTRVNEAKFPAPELQEVPQTLEDLQKLDDAEAKKNAIQAEPEPGVDDKPVDTETAEAADEDSAEVAAESMKKDDAAEVKTDETPIKDDAETEKTDEKPVDEKPAADDSTEDAKEADDTASDDEAEEASGEARVEGSESATATGQALQEAADDDDEVDEVAGDKKDAEKSDDKEAEASEDKTDAKTDEKSDDKVDVKEEMKSEVKPTEDKAADEPEETEDEKQERLEATQEKITKENQRKMDARKDNLAKAQNRVRDLNARFADWYYVIPEETYAKLTIKRDELFQKETDPSAAAGPTSFGGPGGLPGGIPNFGPGN